MTQARNATSFCPFLSSPKTRKSLTWSSSISPSILTTMMVFFPGDNEKGSCSKGSKRDLVKPSPVRVQLWGVSECSRKATQAISSPTRETILNKGKTGPWLDRASHCLAPGCTRNDDCLRIQGTISMSAQQERTNHYTLASSATEPCTDNNHLPSSIFSLGGTKEEYSAFLTASL